MKNKMIVLSVSLVLLVMLMGLLLSPQPANAANTTATPTPTPTTAPTPAVDIKYRWNLDEIYPNPDAWEKDYSAVKENFIPKYPGYQGKLGDSEKFLELLKMDEQANRMMDKLYVYAFMKRDENQADSQTEEMSSRAESLYSDLSAANSFIRPELVALPDSTFQAYLKDETYKDYWMMLRYILVLKEHTLSKEVEAILAQAGEMSQAASSIATKIREVDIQFPTIQDSQEEDIEISEGAFYGLMMDPDRGTRQRAYEGLMNAYGNSKYSLAAALDAQMRNDAFFASVRKYDSALEASLDSNQIPKEVYTALVAATDKNISALHRYVTLRKNILGVEKVRIYDMYLPLVEPMDAEITYAETIQILNSALAPLGKTYLKDMNDGIDNRWIDVYESENKTSGAYSWGTYDTHPYILMNYDDNLDSLLTLAHEFGHALNSYYTNDTQPYIDSSISTFNAEVASTTNELTVLHYLIDNAKDDDEKLFYLDRLAESIRGTFFAQVMYAEFEEDIHERVENGEGLSVDTLNEMWGATLQKYYGPDFELTEEARLGWSRIPHFYYNFYVYQYATGIAAANGFSALIRAEKTGAVEKYQAFLASGSSDYPITLLKTAGVDMLSSQPVDTLLKDFNDVMKQMEDILTQQGKLKN